MIRVFIVAASPLAREGMVSILRVSSGLEVVGAAADLGALDDPLSNGEVDVLLIDVHGNGQKPDLDALAVSDLASDLPVIVLTDGALPGGFAAALRAGVRAVLPLEVSAEQLVASIQAAAAGLVVLPRNQVAATADMARTPVLAELTESLTPREREVLQMLAGGLANKEIAAKLAISEHTVKFHVASILGKLGVSTRTEAVSTGIRHGLILL